REFELDLHTTQARVVELEAALAGHEVDDAAFLSIERAAADLETTWRIAERRVNTVTRDVEQLRAALKRAEELRAEREGIGGRLTVAANLAEDLRSDRFQQFLLDDAFQDLVLGASVRMRQMTDRYTLEWDNQQFMVVDHD